MSMLQDWDEREQQRRTTENYNEALRHALEVAQREGKSNAEKAAIEEKNRQALQDRLAALAVEQEKARDSSERIQESLDPSKEQFEKEQQNKEYFAKQEQEKKEFFEKERLAKEQFEKQEQDKKEFFEKERLAKAQFEKQEQEKKESFEKERLAKEQFERERENAAQRQKEIDELSRQEAVRTQERETVKKPEWKDVEKAEADRYAFKLQEMLEIKQKALEDAIKRVEAKEPASTLSADEAKARSEEMQKAIDMQIKLEKEKLAREYQERMDRLENLYKGLPSGRDR